MYLKLSKDSAVVFIVHLNTRQTIKLNNSVQDFVCCVNTDIFVLYAVSEVFDFFISSDLEVVAARVGRWTRIYK